jgi:iron complex transport system permease protein
VVCKVKKVYAPVLWNVLLLIAAFILSVAAGAVFIPPMVQARIYLAQIPGLALEMDWPQTFQTILLQIRLPHAVLVMLVGAALASSGAAYQGLFRNPLADPYLIGVSSGAALGAVLAMSFAWPSSWLGLYAVPAAAFLGALGTIAIVYFLARTGRVVPVTTLILAGVAVSAFATAVTSFLMLRSVGELRRALIWLLGGSLLPGWEPVVAMLPYLLLGVVVLLAAGHALNVLQFGDEQAQQLGLAVEKWKLLIILAASLATAAAVAFAGVIGFVGLIVPHIVRIIWGPDYRQLVFLSLFGGATLLLIADLLARTVDAPQVLPIGIVTAILGAPFFLWILRRSKAQGRW